MQFATSTTRILPSTSQHAAHRQHGDIATYATRLLSSQTDTSALTGIPAILSRFFLPEPTAGGAGLEALLLDRGLAIFLGVFSLLDELVGDIEPAGVVSLAPPRFDALEGKNPLARPRKAEVEALARPATRDTKPPDGLSST